MIASGISGLLAGLLFCTAVIPVQTGTAALESPCLLLIDIQEFYFPGGRMELVDPEEASANARALLLQFRKRKHSVVHVRHNFEPGGDIHPSVAPIGGEKVVSKDHANAFKDTDLLRFLKDHGIKTLVVFGMMTHMCVEAAVRAAHDLDFNVIVAHDACATRALRFAGDEVSARDVHLSTLSALSGAYAQVVDTEMLLARLLLD